MGVIPGEQHGNGAQDYIHYSDDPAMETHAGVMTPAEKNEHVKWGQTLDPREPGGGPPGEPGGPPQTKPWLHRMAISCPQCNIVTVHPVGGGADPPAVQRFFLHQLKDHQAGRTWEQAKTLAKFLVSQEPGETWSLPDDIAEDDHGPNGAHPVPVVSLAGPASGLSPAAGE